MVGIKRQARRSHIMGEAIARRIEAAWEVRRISLGV